MQARITSSRRNSLLIAAALIAATPIAVFAQSSPSAVPVPFSVAIAGSGVAGTSTTPPNCTPIPTTSGVNYGDGCPAAYSGLDAPQGAAVDQYGNVYVADYTDRLVRVIYNGGASVAALITSTSSGYTLSTGHAAPAPTPVAGDIYTIAGIGGITALTVTGSGGAYECANYATSGQPNALNSFGDGCPAAAAPIGPRDVSLDAAGNLFLTDYTNSRIRVLCVACTSTALATKLIELEEPGVTPVNGAMYTIAGYAAGYRDQALGYGNATIASSAVALLRSPTAAVVSSSDDVYIADNLNNAVRLLYNGGASAKSILTADGYTPTLGYVYTIAGDDCVSALITKTGSVATANACLTTTTASPATPDTASAESSTTNSSTGVITTNGTPVNVAWTVFLDANDNVFYTDAGNARIKVIYGGVAPPLTFPTTAYPTLQTGYAYTFAGQGALTQSGVPPSQLVLSSAQGVGGDANGNIFFVDYTTGLFYETYAQTGLTAIIGGGNAIATAAAGAFCNDGTTGPTMTDAFYDGCPLTQAKLASPRGPIVADASGNLYFADSVGSLLRKFTYYPTFPTTAVGTSSTAQPYAFTFLSSQTLATPTFTVSGAANSTFADAGGDTCTASLAVTGGGPGTTCVVNALFTPQTPGLAAGAVELHSATAVLVLGASFVSGTGVGAGLAVDPGTATTTGANLVPNGIAVEGSGAVLVTDTYSKALLRYTAGTLAILAPSFSTPSGVAIDGAGNIFVADSSANTVTELSITNTRFTLTSAVSNPHNLVTDGFGNLYIADTGNNRILVFGPGATLYTVAGFTGLNAPQAVAVDLSGNLYAADSAHIVKLTPTGTQTTLASSGATALAVDAAGNVLATSGSTLTEYPASGSAITLSSALTTPVSLALDSSGNAFIADNGLTGYLELQRTAAAYAFTSSPDTIAIDLTSIGTASLTAPSYTQTNSTDFSLTSATINGCSGALAVGTTCELTASFSPTTSGPLTDIATFSSNAANASPITLTLTGSASGQSTTTTLAIASSTLVYGSVQTLTATLTGSLSAPTSGTVNFYTNSTTLLGSANVGSNGVATLNFIPTVGAYSVTAVYVPSVSSYFTSTSKAGAFSVTAAALTVTAANASKIDNAPNPALTYTITGFVNSDTQASAVTGAPTESTTATTTSAAGTYTIAITQGTLAAANYTFTFVNGTLTVTGSTSQTLTFNALPAATYGATPLTLSATSNSGLAVTYTVTGPAAISGSTLTLTGAGTVAVTATQNGNNTYAAATPVTQSFSVAPARLTVTAASISRLYGAANPTLAYTITGFVNADSQVTATTGAPAESTTATAASSVGPYPITLTQGTLASTNYTFTLASGTLTVAPATLALTANSVSRVYGAANPTFTGTLTGAVNNDQLTETFSTTATASSPAATYSIVPSATGTNVANYTIAATNAFLTITQAKPAIALSTSATSGFNGATSITLTATLGTPTTGAPTGSVTFFSGATSLATVTISGATAVFSTANLPVGSDSITAVYSGDTNFTTLTSPAVLITISPGFSVTASTAALAFQSGYQEAQASLTINPGGLTDTLTFACQSLPAKLSCAFSPTTLPLSGLTAAQTVQMLVSNSSATASLTRPSFASRAATLALLPLAALLLLCLRRRRLPTLLLLALLTLGATSALTGCGTSPTALEQSAGTYNFTATVSSGSTTLQTLNFTLTIPN